MWNPVQNTLFGFGVCTWYDCVSYNGHMTSNNNAIWGERKMNICTLMFSGVTLSIVALLNWRLKTSLGIVISLPLLTYGALCSRNFQNVKLRLDFHEIWSFYRHSDFTWNSILANSKGPKMLFLAILKVLNFDFGKFEKPSCAKFTKYSKFRMSKIAKNDIFRPFDFAKTSFHVKSEWR